MAFNLIPCQHGLHSFCYADATPEDRANFDTLYAFAYSYAENDGCPEHAEQFAAECAAGSWTPRHGIDLDVDLRGKWQTYYAANIL